MFPNQSKKVVQSFSRISSMQILTAKTKHRFPHSYPAHGSRHMLWVLARGERIPCTRQIYAPAAPVIPRLLDEKTTPQL
jgi:hypothetical protein